MSVSQSARQRVGLGFVSVWVISMLDSEGARVPRSLITMAVQLLQAVRLAFDCLTVREVGPLQPPQIYRTSPRECPFLRSLSGIHCRTVAHCRYFPE